jgi:sentrin-specific protease 8
VCLLRPAIVKLLEHNPNAKADRLIGDLSGATHVFVPLSDGDPATGCPGTHWSLLVVGVSDLVAFHYDSLPGFHEDIAEMVTRLLGDYMDLKLQLVRLDDTPRQPMSTADCGVRVCWAIKHLLVRRLLAVERSQQVDMSLGGKRLDVPRMRREMVRTLENLRKKACRRFVRQHSLPTLSRHAWLINTHVRIHRSVSPSPRSKDTPRIGDDTK